MELVTIKVFVSGMEAAIAQSFLEGNGIEVFLGDENVARNYGATSVMIGGLKLQVSSEDEEMARLLLADTRPIPEEEATEDL